MDNIECLKKFTEDIVKKQNDSMESLKKLSQAIDTVNSDVANLINSLQMVGNRQFAENRILEDDSLTGGGDCNVGSGGISSTNGGEPTNMATQQQKNIYNSNNNKHMSSPTSPSHSQALRPISPPAIKSDAIQLTLCDILHKAIELLPPSEDEYEDVHEEEGGEDEEGGEAIEEDRQSPGIGDRGLSVQESTRNETLAPRVELVRPVEKQQAETTSMNIVDEIVKNNSMIDDDVDDDNVDEIQVSNSTKRHDNNNATNPAPPPPPPQPQPPHRLPVKIEPMDRDRVANILKKYSLYDEDDDDDVDDDDVGE